MKKSKKIIKILAQCTCVVAFAGCFYAYTQSEIKPTDVYEFSRDVPANTILTDGDLVRKSIPKDGVTNQMVTNKNDIVGKAISNKAYSGQYVIKNQLVDAKEIDVFSKMDLSNYRKIALSITGENAIGGNIQKGDTVDLAFVGTGTSNKGDFTYSKIFMKKVLVYNVLDDSGNKYIDTTDGNKTTEKDKDGNTVQNGNVAIVTLAVTPQQAEEIETRLAKGKVKMIGRFSDSNNGSSQGYTIGDYSKVITSKESPEN